MKELSQFLSEKNINLNLTSNKKEKILEELLILISDELIDKEKVLIDLINRESSGSTALEFGLAIPHVRSKYVKDFAIAIGISKEGIDFDSQDNLKTKLFFLVATNSNYNDYHIETLAKIIKLVKNEHILNVLVNTNSKEGLISLIKSLEIGGDSQ